MERPAGTVARFFSTSPPCAATCKSARTSTAAAPGGIEVPERDQVVGQGPGLVQGPGLERGEQRRLVDQPGLQGKQPKQEMAIGSHRDPPMNLGRGSTPRTSERRPVDGRMNVSSVR